MNFRLHVILDRRYLTGDPLVQAQKIIEAGCSVFQYRDKLSSDKDFFYLAGELYQIAKKKNIPFIINDRIDIALSLGVEGVHLGADDLPLPAVRKLLGPDKIIGRSVHSLEEARLAENEGANYVGLGPVFPSQTKIDTGDLIPKKELRALKEHLEIPVVAIGGIKAGNIEELVKLGIENFAICSDILQAKDPAQQLNIIKAKLRKTRYGKK